MKYTEIKNLNEAEKTKMINDFKMKLVKLNLQVSTGTTLKNTKEIREIKKDIARILTSISQNRMKSVTKK